MIRRATGNCFDERLVRQAAPNHTRQLQYQLGVSQSFEHASKVSACAVACTQQAQATSDLPQTDFGNLYVSLEDIQALYSACRLLSCCCIINKHWDSFHLTQQLLTIAASRPVLLHSTVNTDLSSLSSLSKLYNFMSQEGHLEFA